MLSMKWYEPGFLLFIFDVCSFVSSTNSSIIWDRSTIPHKIPSWPPRNPGRFEGSPSTTALRITANCFISTHQERLPTHLIWFWFNDERPELMHSKNLAEMLLKPSDPMLQQNNGGPPACQSHPAFAPILPCQVNFSSTTQTTKQES